MPRQRGQQEESGRKLAMPYVTSEMASIMRHVELELDDSTLVQSLHFSPTALSLVRRVMMSQGHVITDTMLALDEANNEIARRLNISLRCYIDDPGVVGLAEQRHITRAEVALDHALSLHGAKLLVIGSAPMALNRLLIRRQAGPLHDLVVLGMPTGFASVVQLKERLWGSDIPCIVVRGKRGGAKVCGAVLNALMAASAREQNLIVR